MIKDLFTVSSEPIKNKPFYTIHVKNEDGKVFRLDVGEEAWNEKPEIFFYALMYVQFLKGQDIKTERELYFLIEVLEVNMINLRNDFISEFIVKDIWITRTDEMKLEHLVKIPDIESYNDFKEEVWKLKK